MSIANRPTNLKGRLARYTPVHDVDRALRIACELIVMGHHDHGPSFVGESAEDREDGGAVFGVKRAGRLVRQHEAGIVGERACDCDPLALAA